MEYDAIIFTGGNLEGSFATEFLTKAYDNIISEKPFLAAADSGLHFLYTHGIVPDLIMGDFDSVNPEALAWLESRHSDRMIRLNVMKDDTDTQAVVRTCLDRGKKKLALLGGTGSRIDHMLANLSLLLLAREYGGELVLVDSHNRIRLLPHHTVITRDGSFGDYISFFPLNGCVSGLTLKGFVYPLEGKTLTAWDYGLTVSNRLAEETGSITYSEGQLVMIEARD
ncbi:MAG: thiamine diphosphokinase [Blautia sp.]|nr:thiamine diphosphokinase [Blautia sp.]